MNWQILVPFGLFVIALIAFMIMRNQKDKTDYEQQLNNDYKKSKKEDGDEHMED
jgi:cbb3-type cytochrome oxidase subunit 3